ncbi:Sterol desaturase/sphingolipid hydroxylase, fatty acid hydroxylase superfamily [Sphingomonas laterariae]|uniref:Sterol desaturase/sphingolipid hydroxylase, fatty acid hydroxylase superfamily n=1 Tax=Edaphosphingomonas laterariae TaxID=861865 RepID=A0A239CCM0_9SPHN|nr:sterol desaturase family protein [Sphingomonas laterariae]SNS17965.1 Sterol desaturase/sphingolipid hydroxylase, fatty acid hydroxylase superfamily [Sphingomonas laterariae]
MEGDFASVVAKAVTIYGSGFGIFLLFCVASELFLRWREGKRPLHGEGLANMLLFPFGPLAEAIILNALLIAGLFQLYHWTPLRVPVELWTLPIYFIVGEFGYYWFHRAGHEVRILWADHSIHHSAETYDFTVNLRHTPFSTVYRFLTWAPLVLLGFQPLVLVLFAMSGPAFQSICHTERVGRLAPWFEWLFVSPSNHAVHHASNPLYIDRNYGGLLNIWDHVFGTYQRLEEDVPPVYGITRQVKSNNPAKILAHEFRYLARDFRAAPSMRQKLGVLFGKPGETFEVDKAAKAGPAIEQGAAA